MALDLRPLYHRLGERVSLWCGDLDRLDAPPQEDCLSPDEQDRARRFRFERDARRYRTAHTLLRLLLGGACAVPPISVQWRIGEFGKPHLQDGGALHFNMSHCGTHLVVALAEGSPVGVDVESGTTLGASDPWELAQRCFTDNELAELQAAHPELRHETFVRGWTRKEACLKALGSGLSIEPRCFEAGLGSALAVVRIPVGACDCGVIVDSGPGSPGVEVSVAVLAPGSLHLAT